MNWKQFGGLAAAVMMLANVAAGANMRITEWMYQGFGTVPATGADEFIEFTNVDTTPIDMTGWSFDDNTRTPGSQSLSAFGTVNPGVSAILTDMSATDFRAAWGLSPSVPVIGGNANNLGRADELNLYDNSNALVDRLTYDDQTLGGPRTQNKSGNPTSLSALGANNPTQWVLAANGDAYGSHIAVAPSAGDIANPGAFTLYQVPEPNSLMLLVIGTVIRLRRRRHILIPTSVCLV